MRVEPESESLDLFPSEGAEPVAALRQRGQMQRVRGIVAIVAVFALGVLTGSYISVSDERAPHAVAAAMLSPLPNLAIATFQPLRAAVPRVSAAAASSRPNVPAERLRRRNDQRAIQAVLNRYRDAVSTLDAAAVRAVWPTANVTVVRSEFAGLAEQNIDFESCRIASTGPRAAASCAGVVESGFRAGDRRPQSERKRWQFTLHRTGERWTILAVRTQPI